MSRPHLLTILDELVAQKLIILIAPAGYGKTYALVDYLHHTTMPVCWYALDSLDYDPHRFFAHVIASIGNAYPVFEPAAQAALQAFSSGQNTLEQFVTTIVNELYEVVREDFLLVIDDYHLVDGQQEIGNFISRFVQQADSNCHVLLAARRLLTIPDMPLLVARGYVAGLDFEDMAFDADELKKLVLQNYNQMLSDREASELVSVTEGWVTGLLLSTQSKLRNMPDRMRRLRAVGVNLYDYLAQQVLDQQPPAMRDFLLRSSVLDEFNAELCEQVFGPSWLPAGNTWPELVEQVFRYNLFTIPVGEDGEWVRYHYLFRDFLQKQLARERPAEESIILEQLAGFYRARQDWERTHQCYVRLSDLPAIAELIEEAGLSLLQNGRILLLNSWLEGLPGGFLAKHPYLLSLKGEILSRRGEVEKGLALLDEAELAQRQETKMLHRTHTLVYRSVAHRLLGHYQESLRDAEDALELALPTGPNAQGALAARADALKAKGLSLHLVGKAHEAIHALQEALTIHQTLGDAQSAAVIMSSVAMVLNAIGRHAEALTLFEQALEVWRKSANLAGQAVVLNNLGVLHHMQGEYGQALTLLEESHECAQRSAYTRFICVSLTSIGDLFLDLELWKSAQKIYQRAFVIAEQINERFFVLYLELMMARLASATGEWRQAFAHLNTASQLVLDNKSSYEWALYQLTMARSYLAQAKYNEAIASLLDAQQRFAEAAQPIEEAITHFLLAIAYHAVTRMESLTTHLQHGLSLTFGLESRHPVIANVRSLKGLLQSDVLNNTLGAINRLEQLVAEIDVFEQKIPFLSRQLRQTASPTLSTLLVETPPKLIIHALGRSEVIVDGKTVTHSDWQTQVSRDLFFCLLSHPTGLSKEQIGLLFWPDASPNELKTRFKNTVYRLRNALNSNIVLLGDETYRFNHTYDYEYDVENFLNKVAEGEKATTVSLRMAAYGAAVQLYTGSYLPDAEGAWVWNERERLQRLFAETILNLAQLQLDTNDYRAALHTCQRALTDDPCLEEAHRLTMRAYAALGNRSAIVRQYNLCKKALITEIDAPPSPQTEELYALLLHSPTANFKTEPLVAA
jgi:ATP/maltotriose-dependent transcriptional regulator MalT/two-component SAPR family response regulator